MVLYADLTEPPARWHLVATIPYGPGRPELGHVPAGRHTPVEYLPMSFAIGPDRSIWILDWVKKRVAHYSGTGHFVGAVHGLYADRFHPHGRDIMMIGERPVVVETAGFGNALQLAVPAGHGLTRHRVRYRGGGVRGGTLYPASKGVAVSVDGRPLTRTGPISYSPRGFGRADVRSGDLEMLPGIPLTDGSFARPAELGTPGVGVSFIRGSERTQLPIQITVQAKSRSIPGMVGEYPQTSLRHGVVFWIRAEPTRHSDIRRYHDGRWLLAVFDDGSPLLWERLPDPPVDDEIVTRHLAVGPGDSIYLMQVGRRQLWIYRR